MGSSLLIRLVGVASDFVELKLLLADEELSLVVFPSDEGVVMVRAAGDTMGASSSGGVESQCWKTVLTQVLRNLRPSHEAFYILPTTPLNALGCLQVSMSHLLVHILSIELGTAIVLYCSVYGEQCGPLCILLHFLSSPAVVGS